MELTANAITEAKASSSQQNVHKNAWQAKLSLTFSKKDERTVLSSASRVGPLSVQKAFYPEGRSCAHIYLLHPPAGIVSGDELRITIQVNEQAHTLVTTPGANRFYRAREDLNIGDPKQIQHTEITLDTLSVCENFPQETIVYPGADASNHLDINLSASSCYVGWDIACLGLPSSGQAFEYGQYTQLNRVFIDKKLIFHDRIHIAASELVMQHKAGLNGCTVFATMIAYAPANTMSNDKNQALIKQLRAIIEQHETIVDAPKKISITQIRKLLVVRYLGNSAQECKNLFVSLWQLIRPHYMHKTGVVPRIWHT